VEPLATAARTPAPPVEAAPLAPVGARPSLVRASPTQAPESAPGAETAARADEILRQVELQLTPNVKRLVLELEPRELGRLSIQLALRAGKLAAIVRGERPEALALLEARAPELARLLAERGLVTDEVRFELGFRSPANARRGGRNPSASPRSPGSVGAAGPGPVSIDTYA
jgi:flagellar hook-length control protein FliK